MALTAHAVGSSFVPGEEERRTVVVVVEEGRRRRRRTEEGKRGLGTAC